MNNLLIKSNIILDISNQINIKLHNNIINKQYTERINITNNKLMNNKQ